MDGVRIAVVGAGAFGRNHLRVVRQSPQAEPVAAVDIDPLRAAEAARDYGCLAFEDWRDLLGRVDAAIVAVPTTAHVEVGCGLMEAGIDVLVEKPIAPDLAGAARLVETAERCRRILQVGHLERFNPAVLALQNLVQLPLFFEVHRLSVFTPRSLDVDVVLDLMIHDIDIVLHLTGAEPEEVRAAGISILSPKVDIANVRLAFPGGCIANLTASRVSTERVRKLRLFQPGQYISIDYARQDGVVCSISRDRQIHFEPLSTERREPLAAQFDAFLAALTLERPPVVGGREAFLALKVSLDILAKIEEHAGLIASRLAAMRQP